MNQASRVAPSTTRNSYQTRVPPGSRTAFNQAVEHAKQDRSGEFKIERQLILPKPYRLLSPDQAHAYFNMAPSAVPVGWKPNPELVMKYKGWNELVLVSKPYFSRAHDLAIVWAKFGPSCSLQGWFFFRQMPNGWAPEHWQSKQPVTCDGKFLDNEHTSAKPKLNHPCLSCVAENGRLHNFPSISIYIR